MTEVGFPTDSLTTCSGCGILAGEQEQKILQLIAMNHSLKRELDAKDAEIAALTEQTYRLGEKWMEEQSARASERDESRAEIAALREAVRYCYDEGKLTREVEDAIDRARGRRALEEKP